MELPAEAIAAGIREAVAINPNNLPRMDALPALVVALVADPGMLAAIVGKRWSAAGVDLGVSFLDSPDAATRDLILRHANEWADWCNVRFRWSSSSGEVRIDRGGDGYWSYLGTDILSVPKNQPTMTLQGVTSATPESELRRIVPHEFGHTLGFAHEHLRPALVALIDPKKAIDYFRVRYGWSESTTRANVLTPLSERSLTGSSPADPESIMTYQIPGAITIDGTPIRGGVKLSPADQAFAGKLYPRPSGPPVSPGPGPVLVLPVAVQAGEYILTRKP